VAQAVTAAAAAARGEDGRNPLTRAVCLLNVARLGAQLAWHGFNKASARCGKAGMLQEPNLMHFLIDAKMSSAIMPRILLAFSRRRLYARTNVVERTARGMLVDIAVATVSRTSPAQLAASCAGPAEFTRLAGCAPRTHGPG